MKRIHPSVVVYAKAVVFKGTCVVKASSVIGGDGFGFERDNSFRLQRKEHKHKVIIGDDVEIGSCNCIDRGQDRDTIIGTGTKTDNLVHIAHDCIIGKHVGMAAGVILGGSVEIDDYTFIGLNATIKPGVKIGKRCLVGMGAVVLEDMPDDAIIVGNPARVLRQNTFFLGRG